MLGKHGVSYACPMTDGQMLALRLDLHPQLSRPKQHCSRPSSWSTRGPQPNQHRVFDMSEYLVRRVHLDADSQ